MINNSFGVPVYICSLYIGNSMHANQYNIQRPLTHLSPDTDGWFTIESLIGEPCVLYPQGSEVGERFVRNLKERKLL